MGENFNVIYSAHNAFFKAGRFPKQFGKKYGKSDKADKADPVRYQKLQHSPRVSFRNLEANNRNNAKPKKKPPKIAFNFLRKK